MTIRKLQNALHSTFIGALLAFLLVTCHPAVAQSQSKASGKTAAKKDKAKAESCDGALDIVPAKAMSFVRKRRPSNPEQTKPTETKPEKQQPGESKS